MPASSSKYRRVEEIMRDPQEVHPQYRSYRTVWESNRACVHGEDAIKEGAQKYLPQMAASDKEDYAEFLGRAVFVNMTSRTKEGLVGAIFRRAPSVEGIPAGLKDMVEESFTDDDNSPIFCAKKLTGEILEVGRAGALLDRDAKGEAPPYVRIYSAENILDWHVESIKGRKVPTMILLREARQDRLKNSFLYSSIVYISYRLLALEKVGDKFVYKQYLYWKDGADADLSMEPKVSIPKNRGRTFDRIPFEFFGPFEGGADVEKPPLRDIVTLNLAHYRDYAQLQHGRYHTALPIYYAPTAGDNAEYTIGPNIVWQIGPEDEKPGLLEFHGTGLKSLETSLSEKEKQIASLGGRLLAAAQSSGSLSDNELKMKEGNEASLLLNVVNVVDRSMTRLLRLWVQWQTGAAKTPKDIRMKLNTDFLLMNIGAREFRAIQSMYLDGVIPIEVVYDYLVKAEVIPESMPLEDFKAFLDNVESFPNQPDHEARKQGYPNSQARQTAKENEKDRKQTSDLATKTQQQTPAPAPSDGPPTE